MPTYKLSYFNGRGRAEIVRMLFTAADTKFEDIRIESADWPKAKAETPQGSVPVLDVDGKMTICQSMAIARYLAREFKLYGKDNGQMTLIDQIMDTVLDLSTPFMKAAFTKDEAEKETLMKKFQTEDGPKVLGYVQDLMKKAGKGGFAVGDSLTVADLAIYTYLEMTNTHEALGKFPVLAENRKKVAGLPKIKTYLEKRPTTSF